MTKPFFIQSENGTYINVYQIDSFRLNEAGGYFDYERKIFLTTSNGKEFCIDDEEQVQKFFDFIAD